MNQNTKYVDPWRTDEDLAMNPGSNRWGLHFSHTYESAQEDYAMNLAPTGGPSLGRWVPHVGDKRCFSFGWKQLPGGASLYLLLAFLPQTVPSLQLISKPRFIFIGNFSAFSSLPVHAPPPSTDAMDPKGKQKASIPSASSPPHSSSSVISFWQKKPCC